MFRRHRTTYVVCVLWLALIIGYLIQFNMNLLIALMACSLLFGIVTLYSILLVFIEWKPLAARATQPFLACVSTAIMCLVAGVLLRDARFHWYEAEYSAAVHRLQAETPVGDLVRVELLDSESMLAYGTNVEKKESGEIIVEFLTSGGFPVSHSGYLYSSTGQFPTGPAYTSRWDEPRRVSAHWFSIRD